jgi:hypothetical protein
MVAIRPQTTKNGSENAIGADNQQERLIPRIRILRDHMPNTMNQEMVKIWSDLHGDMQSQAEMTWPSICDRE